MANAKLTQAQANYLKLARDLPEDERSSLRATLFSAVKQTFGIPAAHKLRVEIDDVTHPHYLTLFRKKDSTSYALDDNGKWVGALGAAAPAPQEPVRKWFPISGMMLADAAYDAAIDNFYWDDDAGVTARPDMTTMHSHNVGVDADGTVWIALEEADL